MGDALSGSDFDAVERLDEIEARDDVPVLVSALRAVLILHTPEHWELDAFEYSSEGVGCSECRDDYGRMVDYPCATVRAVSDILGVES